MKTEYIPYILTIASSKSINKASAKLYYPAQKLCRVLDMTETEFGCKIFERGHNGVSLTPNGEKILDGFQKIQMTLDSLRDVKNLHRNDDADDVTGNIEIYSLQARSNHYPGYVTEHFAQIYPEVSISYNELTDMKVEDRVAENPGSIGIAVSFSYGEKDDFSTYPELVFIPAYRREVAIFVGCHSPYVGLSQKNISMKMALTHPFALLGERQSVTDTPTYRLLRRFGEPNIQYCTTSQKMFYQLIAQGQCIGLGNLMSDSHFMDDHPEIRVVPIRESLWRVTGLLLHKDFLTDPLNERFIRFFMDSRVCFPTWSGGHSLDFSGFEMSSFEQRTD